LCPMMTGLPVSCTDGMKKDCQFPSPAGSRLMDRVVEDMIATGRNPDTAGQRTWPNWKVADALEAAQARIAELGAETLEQARLLGMSAEREMAHLARIAQLEGELAAAREALINLTAECYADDGNEAFLAAWELIGTFNDTKARNALKASAHD
jgi:hypothetical protein